MFQKAQINTKNTGLSVEKKYIDSFEIFESKLTAHPINEDLSDWLHIATDVISAVADTMVPGTGAIIDLIHSISYFVEASAAETTEKMAFHLQGFITLSSIVLIGPLQQAAVSAKTYIKNLFDATLPTASAAIRSGSNAAASAVSKTLTDLLNAMSQIVSSLTKKINELANSEFGKWIISKFGNSQKAIESCTRFLTVEVPASIRSFLEMLAKLNPTKVGATGAESAELLAKTSAKKIAGDNVVSSLVNKFASVNQQTDQQYAYLGKNQVAVKPV